MNAREVPFLELRCTGLEVVIEPIMTAIKITAVVDLAVKLSDLDRAVFSQHEPRAPQRILQTWLHAQRRRQEYRVL